eukprot:1885418-Pleurochrysis_carterae.AAC.1
MGRPSPIQLQPSCVCLGGALSFGLNVHRLFLAFATCQCRHLLKLLSFLSLIALHPCRRFQFKLTRSVVFPTPLSPSRAS